MAWYWVVAISLVWIGLLYVVSYIAHKATPRINPPHEGLIAFGYVALYLSWPIIVLWLGLINAVWGVWIALVVEAICLLFVPLLWAENVHQDHFPREENIFEKVFGAMLLSFVLVIAPLALALQYADE